MASGVNPRRCTWRSSTGIRRKIAVVSLDCPDRVYPSVSQHHPPALRLERTINDLFGLSAEDLPDARPWLDHNRWGVRFPLGDRIDALSTTAPYRFLAGGRRWPASDCGRPGACGHHRARTFPLYRQRGDRGPAGAAAGIYPQGDRGADARRQRRARRSTRRTRIGRQHRRLCLCVFAGRRGRAATCGAGSRGLAAGAACGTRAARQSSRRHRRDLQRRVLRL